MAFSDKNNILAVISLIVIAISACYLGASWANLHSVSAYIKSCEKDFEEK